MQDDKKRVNVTYPTDISNGKRPRAGRSDLIAVGVLLFMLSITACRSAPRAGTEYYGAQIGIVNHTDKFIDSASVGSGGGGHASAYVAGIANICCVRIPEKWHEGLQLSVRWNMPVNGQQMAKEKIVDVEKYDEPGSVYLHFFPNDHIRIVVTNWVGGSPKHPIPPPPRELRKDLRKKVD